MEQNHVVCMIPVWALDAQNPEQPYIIMLKSTYAICGSTLLHRLLSLDERPVPNT